MFLIISAIQVTSQKIFSATGHYTLDQGGAHFIQTVTSSSSFCASTATQLSCYLEEYQPSFVKS